MSSGIYYNCTCKRFRHIQVIAEHDLWAYRDRERGCNGIFIRLPGEEVVANLTIGRNFARY